MSFHGCLFPHGCETVGGVQALVPLSSTVNVESLKVRLLTACNTAEAVGQSVEAMDTDASVFVENKDLSLSTVSVSRLKLRLTVSETTQTCNFIVYTDSNTKVWGSCSAFLCWLFLCIFLSFFLFFLFKFYILCFLYIPRQETILSPHDFITGFYHSTTCYFA